AGDTFADQYDVASARADAARDVAADLGDVTAGHASVSRAGPASRAPAGGLAFVAHHRSAGSRAGGSKYWRRGLRAAAGRSRTSAGAKLAAILSEYDEPHHRADAGHEWAIALRCY